MAASNCKINILYEDNHLLVVEKPANMLMQGDDTGDDDLLSTMKSYLVERYNKPGEAYLGLVHRLDRPVGGVVVLAKTSKAASRLSDQIRRHQMRKTYLAVVAGSFTKLDGELHDHLYKDKRANITKVVNDHHPQAKEAVLSYHVIKSRNDMSLVRIALLTGRSHQIRIQFADRLHPLWGDQRYNRNAVPGEQIALWAAELRFIHPTTQQPLTFTAPAPSRYPFTIFD